MSHKLSSPALLRIALASEKYNSSLVVACAKTGAGRGIYNRVCVVRLRVFVNTTDLLIVSIPP